MTTSELPVGTDVDEAAASLFIVGNATVLHDDYEAFKSPIEDFVTRVREAGLADRVTVLQRGETRAL